MDIIGPCFEFSMDGKELNFLTGSWSFLSLVGGITTQRCLVLNLKEVVGGASSHMWFTPPGGRVKLKERVLQGVIQLHNRGLVSTAVAIIGIREDGDNISVMRLD